MKRVFLFCATLAMLITGCGSSEEAVGSNTPPAVKATEAEQQQAQANLGATGTATGKEDVPTGGQAPNSPGNEMPADTGN